MSKPLIGITCDYDMEKKISQVYIGYYQAILQSGGLPFLIPRIDEGDIQEVLGLLGGVVFTGGGDVDPAYFGEPPNPRLGTINPYRDSLEIPLCREAMGRDIPVLAICRGIQLMNIAMGGSIYQDLESQWDLGPLQKHTQLAPEWYGSHAVELTKGSRLAGLLKSGRLNTNSFHHQAIKDPADCFIVTARCDDGVVEGIESPFHMFAVGVQWHPERMWEKDGRMLCLFKGMVEASKNRSLGR
ncbi:MAG TPA: gamma-glutamyl-gamma-aminobutyrate hydrolase family protein [Clostridia bacterium]|nr:gamma-glutamyl-gamma-aminobutyrate hydrolase family protein [Clostridia bacterium]